MSSRSFRVILSLAVAWTSATAGLGAQGRTLRAAVVEDFPPLYHVNAHGEPEGLAIDIVKRVAEEGGFRVSFLVVANWGEASQALRDGRADFVPGIGIEEGRSEEFLFSAVPMETVPISVFVRKETSAIKGPGDLGGRRVAVLKDSVAWSLLRKEPGTSLYVCAEVGEAVMVLLSGVVDAVACPGPMMRAKLSEIRLSSRFRSVGEPLAELKRAYMFRREDESFVRQTIDPILGRLIGSGDYRAIYQKWYGDPEPPLSATQIAAAGSIALAAIVLSFLAVWSLTVRRKNHSLKRALSEEAIAKRALAESEERYRVLFAEAPLGIIMITDADKTVRYANSAFLRMFGYGPQDVGSFSALDLVAKAHAGGHGAPAPTAEGGQPDSGVLTCVRKDGRPIRCDIYAAPISVDGNPGTVKFFIDASERERAREELRQNEKLVVLGQLAGGVAHDFNNQLAGISGYAEMLAARLGNSREGQKLVEGILTAVQRSADLTLNLLAFARKGKYEEQDIDMDKIVNEASELLSRSIDKRIRIRTSADTRGFVARGDPSQLQNAVLNLVVNARDAMPSGGDLNISCSLASLGEEDMASEGWDLPPGAYLRVAVKDDGIGMSPETLNRAIEPFFTTKEPGKGTGMGLPAVYGTVRNHGGAFRLRSEEGKGSVAEFLLPAFESKGNPDAKDEGAEGEGSAALPAGRLRILLVDDEESIRLIGREMLTGAGLDVMTAKDGEEAVRLFCAEGQRFDAIVLDMMMPGLSGIEVFARVISCDPDARVVVTSGYSLDGEAQAMMDSGARAFLHKPFRRAELLSAIEAAVR